MKNHSLNTGFLKSTKALFPAMGLLLLSVAFGGEVQHWVGQDSSALRVHGKSSLIPWILRATRLEVGFDLLGPEATKARSLEQVAACRIANLLVQVPVEGLKSTEGPGMDKNTWAALKSKQSPLVTFAVESADFAPVPGREGLRRALLTGTVRIAGKEKALSIPVEAEIQDQKLLLRGQVEITMTDFGILPPVISKINVADKVVVDFSVSFAPGN